MRGVVGVPSLHPLESDHDGFAAQQDIQTLVAKARPELRERLEPIANRGIAHRSLRTIVPARTREPDDAHRSARLRERRLASG